MTRTRRFSPKILALLSILIILHSVGAVYAYTLTSEGSAQLQLLSSSVAAFVKSISKGDEYLCINASGHIELRIPDVSWAIVPKRIPGRKFIDASELSEQDKHFMEVVHDYVTSSRKYGFDPLGNLVSDFGITRIYSKKYSAFTHSLSFVYEDGELGIPYGIASREQGEKYIGKHIIGISITYVYDGGNQSFNPIIYQRIEFILKNFTITTRPYGGTMKTHLDIEREVISRLTALGPFTFLENRPTHKFETFDEYRWNRQIR